MGTFSAQLSAFATKAKGSAEEVTRKVVIDIGTSLVKRSPVGNAELWAQNKTAAGYNKEVSDYNATLRNDQANLTKNGRLKRGLKVNDSMDVHKPDGYVGGRFRGNWQYGFGSQPSGELDVIDPSGRVSIARIVGDSTGTHGVHYLVNNLPYAQKLEDGHSSQAPNGMVKLAILEFGQFVDSAVKDLP